MMKIHYLQHVPFEGLGSMEQWLHRKSASVSATKFFEHAYLPPVHEIDWLIVMGGPMSVNDQQYYSWLQAEKKFIAEAIEHGKHVLGICLGAQLIASALGARVYPNRHREIGWFPVEHTGLTKKSGLDNILPSRLEVFHWHGETFDLPANAVHLARSEGCEHQAFRIDENVLGLQFHLESTPVTVGSLTEQCKDDLIPGRYVQSAEEMFAIPGRFHRVNAVMDHVLDYWSMLMR
jgi:GMP synthase-like glutamine amidotransferase